MLLRPTILVLTFWSPFVSSFAVVRPVSSRAATISTTASSFLSILPPRRSFTKCPTRRSFSSSVHLGIQLHDATDLLKSYASLLRQYPITTKGITAAILSCTGDAIAQWRSEASSYDIKRGLAFLCFGALYTGAFQHFWFDYLGQHIHDWGDSLGVWGPERVSLPVEATVLWDEWWKYFDVVSQLEHPPSPTEIAAGKVVLNQLLVVPVVYMPLFLAMTGLLSGLDTNQSMARAQSLYVPLLNRNWFFWLPMQFLQFLVIPNEFQIPFLSMASLVWTVILSSIGTTAPASPATIVAYETVTTIDEKADSRMEEIVTVLPVEVGAVNQITDDVRLEDVEKTLGIDQLVETVKDVATDARTQLATGGLAAGLLASAADEATLGAVVGDLIGAEVGVGVAVVTAVGASVGLLAAATADNAFNKTDNTANDNEGGLVNDEQVMDVDVMAAAVQEFNEHDEDLMDNSFPTIDASATDSALTTETRNLYVSSMRER